MSGSDIDRALLDTDTVSEMLKRRNPAVQQRSAEYLRAHGRFAVSAVTVMEVVTGFAWAGQGEKLSEFLTGLQQIDVVPFGEPQAVLGGRITARLKMSGQPIGFADPMIAATAIQGGLVLVTGNTQHYARIRALGYDLRLDCWHGR